MRTTAIMCEGVVVVAVHCSAFQYVACVLQCVTACRSVLQCVAAYWRIVIAFAMAIEHKGDAAVVYCSALQCVAVYCSAL
jgi:hypothetical protein